MFFSALPLFSLFISDLEEFDPQGRANALLKVIGLGFVFFSYGLILYGSSMSTWPFYYKSVWRQAFLAGGPLKLAKYQSLALILPAVILSGAWVLAVLSFYLGVVFFSNLEFALNYSLGFRLTGGLISSLVLVRIGFLLGWIVHNNYVVTGVVVALWLLTYVLYSFAPQYSTLLLTPLTAGHIVVAGGIPGTDLPEPGWGYLVLGIWLAVILILALATLRGRWRRDLL